MKSENFKNEESIRNLGKKNSYDYFEILEEDTNKQVKRKEIK